MPKEKLDPDSSGVVELSDSELETVDAGAGDSSAEAFALKPQQKQKRGDSASPNTDLVALFADVVD